MTGNILVVDDDEFLRSIVQKLLERSGYSVDVAEDGQVAWEKIEGGSPNFDLMLLDRNMPRMNGMALLERIKSDERFKELPVIMLTGDSQQQDIVDGLTLGAYYYLTKPFTEKVIQMVVKNAIDAFRQRRELLSLLSHRTESLRLLHRAEFNFRTMQEAKDLALLLAEASMDPRRTVNGYSALLINAVEHGNLGLGYAEKSRLLQEGRWTDEIESRLQHPSYSVRRVNVVLEKSVTSTVVTISDQGRGFNWHNYLDFNPERAFDLHGRGIAISKAVSFDSIEYLGSGNTVVTALKSSAPA